MTDFSICLIESTLDADLHAKTTNSIQNLFSFTVFLPAKHLKNFTSGWLKIAQGEDLVDIKSRKRSNTLKAYTVIIYNNLLFFLRKRLTLKKSLILARLYSIKCSNQQISQIIVTVRLNYSCNKKCEYSFVSSVSVCYITKYNTLIL